MTDAEQLQASLLETRNEDGGWPSRTGRSWTEPTALALLALQGTLVSSETRSLTASWLAHRQSSDGGWPPCAAVPTSTWVTGLALLALADEPASAQGCPRGALWLSNHVYPELSPFQRFLQQSLGINPSRAPGSAPWFPGTAGWVIPTAFSILALSCWSAHLRNADLSLAVHRAQNYLLSRRCSDGGWNHGGSLQRSETSPSYPETTGLALLALANNSTPSLEPTLRLAESQLQHPDSTEGLCWLLMGLAAHGLKKEPPPWSAQSFSKPAMTTQEIALRLITWQALHGPNPFLKPAL
jgi:hypothetical protein